MSTSIPMIQGIRGIIYFKTPSNFFKRNLALNSRFSLHFYLANEEIHPKIQKLFFFIFPFRFPHLKEWNFQKKNLSSRRKKDFWNYYISKTNFGIRFRSTQEITSDYIELQPTFTFIFSWLVLPYGSLTERTCLPVWI